MEWLLFDPEDEDRVLQGETADDWASGDDELVFAAWSSTMAAVLGETLELYGPEPDFDDESDDDEGDDEEFNFTGQGMAIAILLFLARREGLTGEEFTEVLWENAAGGDVDEDDEELSDELAEARERWEEEYGDPARLLLDRLHTVLAITEEDDVIRLTPLALAALHEQLVEAGVDIPLLPPTAAELTGSELLAMAEGVSDAEFEAEAQAWVESRGDDPAARELLELAAEGHPGERMLAVAVVTAIGAAGRAGPAREPGGRAAARLREGRAALAVGHRRHQRGGRRAVRSSSSTRTTSPGSRPTCWRWPATTSTRTRTTWRSASARRFRSARRCRCSTRWPAAPTRTPRTCSTTSAGTTRTSRSRRRPGRPRTKPPRASGTPGNVVSGSARERRPAGDN